MNMSHPIQATYSNTENKVFLQQQYNLKINVTFQIKHFKLKLKKKKKRMKMGKRIC